MEQSHRRSAEDVEAPPLYADRSQDSSSHDVELVRVPTQSASHYNLDVDDPELNAASSNLNPQLFIVDSRAERPERVHSKERGPSRNGEPEETYPEGGREAWLCVLGSWMALCAALGVMNTLATFQAYVAEHQLSGYSEGTIGWIFSLFTFGVFFMGIYIGPIFDKYGPRWLILIGTISITTSLMLMSVCTQYWHFILTFGVLNGFGTSFLFTPSLAAVGHFFRARRGFATGVAATGGSIGGIVFPLMLQNLFDKVGWGWSIRVLGFLCLGLAIPGNLLIRSRLPPDPDASVHPDWRIFRNIPFLLTTIGIFLLEFSLFIPLAYISQYARAHGFAPSFSYQVLAIVNAASFVGRILPGWYADVIGPFNANIIAVVLSFVACLAVWLPAGGTMPGLVIFCLIFGFASGSNISLIPVCIGRLCRTQQYGRYYATCYTLVAISCLIGIPIAGEVLAANDGDYKGLIIMTGMVYVGSGLFTFAAKVAAVGWKPWKKF